MMRTRPMLWEAPTPSVGLTGVGVSLLRCSRATCSGGVLQGIRMVMAHQQGMRPYPSHEYALNITKYPEFVKWKNLFSNVSIEPEWTR